MAAPQEYYCVRISLIGGDPNMNGGRDSNGYYRGYLEGMRYPPAAIVASPVMVEVRVYYDSGTPLFADGTRLMAYHFQITVGSPTPSDDGFMLLMPCYNSPPAFYGGFYTWALALTVSTSNTAQFAGGGTLANSGVTMGTLSSGTITFKQAGMYRVDACLSTISLPAGAAASANLDLILDLNSGTHLAIDTEPLIVTAIPTHIDLATGNPDTYGYHGATLHLGVFGAWGFVAGDVLQTRMNLSVVGINGGQAYFFVERIGD